MMKGSLPHILLLVTDQFRYDAVSPVITPNLYALEQSNGSTTFHRAYSSTPSCTPARAALLTGKSPWAHGMLSHTMAVNCTKYPTTLPRVLRDELGYRTVAIGKNQFGPIKHIQGYQNETIYDSQVEYFDDFDKWFNETMPGMDPKVTCQLGNNDWRSCPYWYEDYLHPTAWTTRTALNSLQNYFDSNETAAPLFFKLSYNRPHSPYDPPRRILDQYLEGGSKSQVPQLERFVNDSSWDKRYKDLAMEDSAWAGDPGSEAARQSRAGYLGSVEFVDENIGKVFDFLRSMDLWDDFMIVWTSDHGDQNGDHYLWRKGYPWDGSARIRMVMKPPQSSHRPPQQSHAIVENRDVAPTLYDMTGVLPSVRVQDRLMDGKSLLSILNGQNSSVRDWVDLEHGIFHNVTNHWNAIVGYLNNAEAPDQCSLWKYIFNTYFASEHLFCLDNDPNETYDLANLGEFSNILSTWRNRMIQQFEREERGEEWVQDHQLQRRVESKIFGNNFPCKEGPKLQTGLRGRTDRTSSGVQRN